MGQRDAGEVGARQRNDKGPVLNGTRPTAPLVHITYEPGYASGWHVHPELHEVTVLSGALTVYGDDCRPTVYGAGQRYVGGRQPHLATNEAAEALEMVVRWITRGALPLAEPPVPVEAPARCEPGEPAGLP